MAKKKLTDDEVLAEVLKRDLPGFERARKGPRQGAAKPRTQRAEASTPDSAKIKEKVVQFAQGASIDSAGTADLLKKYLGNPHPPTDASSSESEEDADDIKITAVKRKRKPDEEDPDDEPRQTKAAVWSKSKKRIEGQQG